jgi:hypothetical protein
MLTISSAYVSIRQETSAYVSIPFEETEEVLSRSHNTKNKGVVTPLSSLSLRNECVRFAGRPDASSQHQRQVQTGLGCRVEESHNEEYESAATGSLVSFLLPPGHKTARGHLSNTEGVRESGAVEDIFL